MKVIKTTTSNNETSSLIDFSDDLKGLNKTSKRQALRDIGDLLVEQTLLNVGEIKSPIVGEKIPSLTSVSYKDLKKGEVGNTKANLELSGVMLDSLDFNIKDDKISIGVFGEAALRADGHNNLSGKSSLPQRRFLPDKGQNYKTDIAKEVSRIIADYKTEGSGVKKALKDIESKKGLYDLLGSITGLTSRSEIKLAVLRNQDLLETIYDLELDSFL